MHKRRVEGFTSVALAGCSREAFRLARALVANVGAQVPGLKQKHVRPARDGPLGLREVSYRNSLVSPLESTATNLTNDSLALRARGGRDVRGPRSTAPD